MPRAVVAAIVSIAACVGIGSSVVPNAAADSDVVSVALFFDSTETAYRVADHLYLEDPAAHPQPPAREFVTDADDAHERLLSGQNPIVGMSLDDVISLVDGDDPRADDLVVITGVHTGFLQLITAPDIVDLDQLRAQKVAVDTDTVYASALFAIMAMSGLQRDADYTVVYAGATNTRYEKLLNGDFGGTLLGAPFTDLALAQGYHSQGSVRDQLKGYQGVVVVAKQDWLNGHEEAARRTVASLLGAEQWAMAPGNRDEAADVVAQAVPGLADDAVVQAVTDTLFGPDSEYQPDGRLSPEDIAVVVDLYNTSRGKTRTVESVTEMIDYRYLPVGGN